VSERGIAGKTSRGQLAFLVLLVVVASGCGGLTQNASSVAVLSPAGHGSSAPAPSEQRLWATSLQPLVATFDGDASLWIARPDQTEPLFSVNPDRPVLAASLYKLAVMLEVERRVEAGGWSYKDPVVIRDEDVTVDGSNEFPGTVLTVDEALEEMITYSDNGSALALLRLVGAQRVNATLGAAGLSDFHVAVNADDDHTITARAVGSFFALLGRGQLLSPAASRRMLERLQRQHINDRMPAKLPAGTVVAHKTGDLVGYAHDGGLIQSSSGPVIFVALTQDAPQDDARQFIAEAAALAYEDASSADLATDAGSGTRTAAHLQIALPAFTSPPGWRGWAGAGGLLVVAYVYARSRRRRTWKNAYGSRGPVRRHARSAKRMAVPDTRRRR
jgi:beta-lactamase class A